jgi:hypothetical protein
MLLPPQSVSILSNLIGAPFSFFPFTLLLINFLFVEISPRVWYSQDVFFQIGERGVRGPCRWGFPFSGLPILAAKPARSASNFAELIYLTIQC